MVANDKTWPLNYILATSVQFCLHFNFSNFKTLHHKRWALSILPIGVSLDGLFRRDYRSVGVRKLCLTDTLQGCTRNSSSEPFVSPPPLTQVSSYSQQMHTLLKYGNKRYLISSSRIYREWYFPSTGLSGFWCRKLFLHRLDGSVRILLLAISLHPWLPQFLIHGHFLLAFILFLHFYLITTT